MPATTLLDLPRRKPISRKAMIAYLTGHPRYFTMNSWNQATSYSRCIKVSNLEITHDQDMACYEMLGVESAFEESGFNETLREFDRSHQYAWQIGSNGRSGGYLVLYQGGQKFTGHRSYCLHCGRRNYQHVLVMPENPTKIDLFRRYFIEHPHWTLHVYPNQSEVQAIGITPAEIEQVVKDVRLKHEEKGHLWVSYDDTCGVCHRHGRRNYDKMPMESFTMPGKGLDMGEDFEDWDTSTLRDRVDLVWEFDQTCELACRSFIDFATSHKVEEQTVMVPTKVNVAVEV